MVKKRMLLRAIFIGYIILVLMVQHQFNLDWEEIESFRSLSPNCAINRCDDEPKPRVDGGSEFVGMVLFGWIIPLTYISMCELLWRIGNRRSLRQQRKPTITTMSLLWVFSLHYAVKFYYIIISWLSIA
jgi:hypothetical protein